MAIDPLFMANSLYRRRKFDECAKVCTDILQNNPYDQVSGNQDNTTTPRLIFLFHRLLGFSRLELSLSKLMLMKWTWMKKE